MSLFVIDDHPLVRQAIGMLLRRLRAEEIDRRLAAKGMPYSGVLFAGLMLARGLFGSAVA